MSNSIKVNNKNKVNKKAIIVAATVIPLVLVSVLTVIIFVQAEAEKQFKKSITNQKLEQEGVAIITSILKSDSIQKNDDNNFDSNMGSEEAAIENFSYEENPRGGITITGLFDDTVTDIVIPEMIEGKRVTAIGGYAFFGCSSLISIEISSGVSSIGGEAFSQCYSLKEIKVAPENKTYKSEEGVLYTKDGRKLVIFPMGYPAESYAVRDETTIIGDSAFFDCSSLKSIQLPFGLKEIKRFAFSGCSSLTSLELPSGVTKIEDYTFNKCSSLAKIVLPLGVTAIGEGAFSECSALVSIELPSGVTKIEDYAFFGCHGITITTHSGSYAETYARKNGISVETH